MSSRSMNHPHETAWAKTRPELAEHAGTLHRTYAMTNLDSPSPAGQDHSSMLTGPMAVALADDAVQTGELSEAERYVELAYALFTVHVARRGSDPYSFAGE